MVKKKASNRLRQIKISGGFLDGLDFGFAPGLNCVIGERGTGKTSFIEFIRYALDIWPSDANARKRIETIVTGNLAGGHIELGITTSNGIEYIVSRTAGESPMLLKGDGTPSGQYYTPNLFHIDIFSQNEVETIADSPSSQLELIESFDKEELDSLSADIAKMRKALEDNASRMNPLQEQIGELKDAVDGLPGIEDKLRGYTVTSADSTLNVSQANTLKAMRSREQTYAEGLEKVYINFADRLKNLLGGMESGLRMYLPSEFAESPNFEVLKKMYALVSDCGKSVDEALSNIRDCLMTDSWRKFDEARKQMHLEHQSQEVAYTELIEKSKADKALVYERMQLEKERNNLLEFKRQLEEKNVQLEALGKERKELKKKLSELLDKRFAKRMEIVRMINDSLQPRIRVTLQQFENREPYQEALADELKGQTAYFRVVAGKIADSIMPEDLVKYIRKGDKNSIVSDANINANQAQAVLNALKGKNGKLTALELVDLPDKPQVELNDNGNYKTTDKLSTGQKCNAILPILLLDSTRPLIIDQPEDNLDNGYIHDTIVSSIQAVKNHRQLVLVTHNPNIPVLGDAERMLVLGSDGRKGHIRKSGSIDECKDEIVNLLEGGEKAFLKRKERYAY